MNGIATPAKVNQLTLVIALKGLEQNPSVLSEHAHATSDVLKGCFPVNFGLSGS